MALGYWVARTLVDAPSTWWLALASALALLAIFLRGRWASAAFFLAIVCFAAGWFTFRIWEAGATSLARHLDSTPRLIEARGIVTSGPRQTQRRGRLAPLMPSEPSATFLLEAESLATPSSEPKKVSGTLRVFVRGDIPNLEPGARVEVLGMARGVQASGNPGQIDGRLHARMRNQVGTLEAESPALVRRLKSAEDSIIHAMRRWQGTLRLRSARWLETGDHQADDGANESRALLLALALGQREATLGEVDLLFQRTGLAHVLAVSGLHLMVLVGLVAMGLRALGARPMLELLVLGALVGAYVLIVPARGPIVRAAIMALALLAASAGGRRYDRVTMLGLAATIVLLWRPLEVWSMGFQLSFGVVLGLLTLTRPLRERLFARAIDPDHRSAGQLVSERAKDAMASALCAWLIATPILMHHVGIVAPLAVFSVLIVMPIVTLLLALAFGASALSAIAPELGASLAWLLQSMAGWFIDLVRWVDTIPGSTVYLPSVSAIWASAALVAIVLLIRGARRTGLALGLASACWLGASLTLVKLPSDHALRLDTFDVGNGSCHLIRAGDDAVLFDCGSLRLDLGERRLPQALREVGAWRVRRAIISHANIDHFAALIDLIDPLGIEEVMLGPSVVEDAIDRPGGAAAIVLDELARRSVRVRTIHSGEIIEVGATTFEMVSPSAADDFDSANDRSIVLLGRVETEGGQRRVLLTGDIQADAMRAIRARLGRIDVDVLEAPHHGSAHTDAYEFVRWTGAQIVVQSTGRSRLDDPRWEEVRAERRWLVTARDGAISVIVDTDGNIVTRTWRPGPLPDARWRLR